ncbi:E3 ubiquitin-protein ligase At4g11680-like [Malania oleifera]|uniref:E3 ubiquitin-protein ligase At4g11680-like n=1 Tax=Malania oleifera TaxID=397392 RepID=UPI0025AE7B7D|nr:E3 ubiquitin-protein ligase At4g11680-like [Malania oleifera]
MVIKNLVSFIFNLIGLRGRRRIKARACCVAVTEAGSPGNVSGLPVRSRSDGEEGGAEEGDDDLCCVCLCRLMEGGDEKVRVLPCLHRFHGVCVDKWFSVCRRTCPVCRFSMEGDRKRFEKMEQLTEEMVTWFSSFHVAGF